MRTHRFDIVITFACFALLGYFAWHAWHGPRGYAYRSALLAERGLLAGDLAEFQLARTSLQKKVALLHPDHVDPDMLDELARQRLEMARPNELVAFEPKIPQENP